ncbi:MAG: serine protease [Actinobacteria bacterium 13_2_20CM_2_71_6]|nr:MAG: serine protease [Actinobacteria bacterium 13_2_20CM_2_71_6]
MGPATVTLITGDRLRLFRQPAGQLAVGVEPAPGREHVGFLRDNRTGPRGTDLSVIPSDAAPLLAAGRLDARLFDVNELVRLGYTDAVPTLPLIVTYHTGAARPMAAAGAATAVRTLPSINATVVRADKRHGSEFWAWLTGASGGFRKVWLDGIAHPTLDVSVPQIGAPTAWGLGFTGKGVTVGVLDTGIKADHPDLAGKVLEAKDFTGTRPDASDDIGHGTHVAGIIAGTGAASNGRDRGVAPDANLVSGKVCVSFGCPDSAVIAGMEWIAPKVRVVNMSLGGGATDGTDPLSQAVNSLSAQYGTLFVIAAGNDRSLDQPDPVESVVAPAVADAALAVGSVTKQDETSLFSPHGPRLGDYAVKPDIAAPGSDIVSARAAGTPAGDADPVDDNYARMSGTSMAAPHVAGAAAILAQQHPDWAAGRLKPALTSTAKPTAGVFEQGAGRVDVARAVTQPVSATGGSLNYGFFAWPHSQLVGKTVTYRNDGAAAITLTLAVAAAGPDGKPAPAGLFTASAGQVVVPAHGAADVTVTLHAAAGGVGLSGGRLTATAPGITVQTALAAYLEPESYNLTVRVASRSGRFDSALAQAVNAETGQAYGIRSFDATGTAVVRLPKARYDINGFDISAGAAAATLVSRPDLVLRKDMTLTLDATAGRTVSARVDRPDATLQVAELGIASANPAGDRSTALSWFARPGHQLFAVPTDGEVTDHPYTFFFRTTLAAVPPGTDPAAYVYQLAFLKRGRIPAGTSYAVHNRDLATVRAHYYSQGGPADPIRIDYARFAVPGANLGIFDLYPHPLPSHRIEYYTANPDVTWQHVLAVLPADQSDAEVNWSYRSYRPGTYRSDWNRAPLGPAFGDARDGWGVLRTGDQLSAAVTLLSGDDPAQYTAPPAGFVGATELSRDGVVLGTSPVPGFGTFPIPATPGTYTLHASGTRSVPWSVIGSSVDVAWTFHEPGAAAPAAPLPLLVVRARGEVDEQGRAPAGDRYPLNLTVQRQPGAPAARLAGLQVEESFDDGATWQAAPTERDDERGTAMLRNPPGNGFVSLRISARDAAGNTVTQTVIRAYQTAPVPCPCPPGP